MAPYRSIPLSGYSARDDDEILNRSEAYLAEMRLRRTVREYSERPVPRAILESCVRTAGTAPSGANRQPWHFVIVEDPAIKRRIRAAAEAEEREFYADRAPAAWLAALEPLGTDSNKPFLETAPALIAIFAESYAVDPQGGKSRHYYVQESTGIATGMLIAALHHAGLVTLTHTPSPMGFLNGILGRPSNERAFLLLVVGHPAPHATVPDIERKPLEQIASFV